MGILSAEFYFENIEQFQNKLNQVKGEYTEIAEKHLKRAGNQLKKIAQDNTPRQTGHLAKSWKGKTTGIYVDEIQYELRNTSKIYHLVEKGHVMKTRSGKVVGFVQGKHFFDKSVDEFQNSNVMQNELEKFFNEIKSKLE